jgi:hypothetical protein
MLAFLPAGDWHFDCFHQLRQRAWCRLKEARSENVMRYNPIKHWSNDPEQDFFETVSEEEVIGLWRSIKDKGLSEDDAWHAIVTGIALDMAFSKTKASFEIEH